mgnify:CR=1 FL=1
MGIYLNPGTIEFQESINSEIYVDKTMLIERTNAALRTKQSICVSAGREDLESRWRWTCLRRITERIMIRRRLFDGLEISHCETFPHI